MACGTNLGCLRGRRVVFLAAFFAVFFAGARLAGAIVRCTLSRLAMLLRAFFTVLRPALRGRPRRRGAGVSCSGSSPTSAFSSRGGTMCVLSLLVYLQLVDRLNGTGRDPRRL